jgi:UDP-N-acetylmuramoyl-tripeptide--D-alanyl-D-alanine ligase
MQDYEVLLAFVTNVLFVTVLGWYLITNLQWYDYKLSRVVLKHHKPHWHLFYFFIPFIAYYTTGQFFSIFFYFGIIPAMLIWYKRLDKKLVLTWRVKRFLILLVFLVLFQDMLCTLKSTCGVYGVFMPLALAYMGSYMIEKFLFATYKKEAKRKLLGMKNLEIVCVTGSYGKTSIKNFIGEVLARKYKVYATPRSVNTIGGIVADINNSLPEDTQIYVCEAGARERGDIYEIATFLEPQRVVVGKVGEAHIEYFKSLDNIIATKLEIMQSPRLQKAFIHTSVTDEPHEKVEFFGDEVQNPHATLDGIDFEIDGIKYHTNILGEFQTINIAAAIKIAKSFGMSDDEVKTALGRLKPVEHRLQKIVAGGKIILDDGYNGNIDGMLEGVRLASLHNGRKVIVTPGLVESSDELNLKLIDAINGVFDIVIVTGSLNANLFDKNLKVNHKIMLLDKSTLNDVLAKQTKAGDIILFANDAPNFI